jgi:putative salt-induced outer membrane protein
MSVALILLLSNSMFDDTQLKVDREGLSGAVNFNLSSASGNTDNTVLGGRIRLAHKRLRLKHVLEAGGNYTETTKRFDDGRVDTEVTQNQWFGQYRAEYETGDRSFAFARTRYEEDQFSGFDRRVFVGAGMGLTLWSTDTSEFKILSGPGYQYAERVRPETPGPDFERVQRSAAFFLGQDYRQVLRENVTIEQSFDATLAEQNTTLASQVALKTDITDKISSRIAYSIKHETQPPAGREPTDTLLTASIGYSF